MTETEAIKIMGLHRSGWWRGAAKTADTTDKQSAYLRIAQQLDAGVDPTTIVEIRNWLGTRVRV